MNKADTPEQRAELARALGDSEAVQGARKAVKELFEGKTMTDIKPEQIDKLIDMYQDSEYEDFEKTAQALRQLKQVMEERDRLRKLLKAAHSIPIEP